MLPNGLELSRPGRRSASILAPQGLDARQPIVPSPAGPLQVRVVATSANPVATFARGTGSAPASC